MNASTDKQPGESGSFRQHLTGTRVDRFLLALVLAGIAIGWFYVRELAGGGTPMVDIYHGRMLLAEYPLAGSTPVHFPAEGDIGISEVVISDGEVFVGEAPCKTKQCIRTGHRHRIGDSIVCVPNRILVAIRGDAQAFDAVVE